jgi:hypothetical protein
VYIKVVAVKKLVVRIGIDRRVTAFMLLTTAVVTYIHSEKTKVFDAGVFCLNIAAGYDRKRLVPVFPVR